MLAIFTMLLVARAETFAPRPADASGVRAQIKSRDGLNLSYMRFGGEVGPDPVVISPGRGESAYRYEELATELIGRGFGPVYILEHRSQGFSSRTAERRQLVHVDSFDQYATDLTDFIKTVTRRPPLLIAHSMGGAVANLALLKDPAVARKVVYVAPMLDINTSWMNMFRDRPAYWLTKLLCAAGLCDELALAAVKAPGPRQPPSLHREYAEGIYSTGVTPGWLKAAIDATWTLRAHASSHHEPSLFLIAKYDRLVQNEAVRAYVCEASNCRVEELEGSHSLHLNQRAKQPLVEAIVGFFSTCAADLTTKTGA